MDGIRLCLTSPAVLADLISLVVFIFAATPIALYVFRKGYDAARKDGSLGQY